ncbi:MAG: dUTP diphosphatase [Anaerotardibacter sp.]
MNIPIKKLSNNAITPKNAYVGDGGVDLYSTESVTLKPFQRALVGTGIALELPAGYAAFVVPRSGLAIKEGLSLVNSPGLIDSNYRGEIKAILINLDPEKSIEIKPGDRICQLVISPVETPTFIPVNYLASSERGEGGFGSSGI